MNDRIEKQIELRAPVSRVWRALTDYREFGEWFRVKLGGPFVQGQISRGHITYPGYEHVQGEAVVEKMEPKPLFSFIWPHPKSLARTEYSADYSHDPRALVEFKLERTKNGTRLRITESGFDPLSGDLRLEAFRRNEGGWMEQIKNMETHVTKVA
ncbi:MAG TPA: SRPBCC family protein [Terriglobales bacterium]|nr:SRPBCC family protein [Terriglobales bacterium]